MKILVDSIFSRFARERKNSIRMDKKVFIAGLPQEPMDKRYPLQARRIIMRSNQKQIMKKLKISYREQILSHLILQLPGVITP
jgi:hypothetical protein